MLRCVEHQPQHEVVVRAADDRPEDRQDQQQSDHGRAHGARASLENWNAEPLP